MKSFSSPTTLKTLSQKVIDHDQRLDGSISEIRVLIDYDDDDERVKDALLYMQNAKNRPRAASARLDRYVCFVGIC